MARYDVYEIQNSAIDFVLDIQADLLNHLKSTVVIPMVDKKHFDSEILEHLHPVINVNDQDYILVTTDLSAIPRSYLGACVCNIRKSHDLDITNALDFLFQGF